MDPAFSLADELAGLPHHAGDEDELEFHPHTYADFAGASLDDELADLHSAGGSALDAELEGLHLHNDLASELGAGGGDLASELDPTFTTTSSCSASGSASPPPPRGDVDAATTVPQLAATTTQDLSAADLTATDSFLSLLSVEADETSRLEAAAAAYLKCVARCSAQREEQLRELRRLERDVSTPPPPPSIPASGSSTSDLFASSSEDFPPPTTPTRHRRNTSSTSTTSTIHPPPPTLLDTALFAPLYTSTSALLGSLTSLHEHAQVTKSSTADAARKLKTVKGLIAQWRGEVESVESSEAWIAQQHAHEAGGERRGKQWAEEQVEWCRKRWEGAEGLARSLLTPVTIQT